MGTRPTAQASKSPPARRPAVTTMRRFIRPSLNSHPKAGPPKPLHGARRKSGLTLLDIAHATPNALTRLPLSAASGNAARCREPFGWFATARPARGAQVSATTPRLSPVGLPLEPVALREAL